MSMAQPRGAARTLAERLRELRETSNATQRHVARALDVSVPLISSWENVGDPKVPPAERISAYARLFATSRSFDGDSGKLCFDLTDAEEAVRQALERELLLLRMSALGGSTATPTAAPSDGFWHFSDGAPVTIVAGVMPNDGVMSSSYTDPASPDYVELYTYSDPDSLLELHGHIRAANPDSQVNFFRSDQLDRDHLTTHLVLLGGVDVNVLVPEVVAALGVPVHQNIR